MAADMNDSKLPNPGSASRSRHQCPKRQKSTQNVRTTAAVSTMGWLKCAGMSALRTSAERVATML